MDRATPVWVIPETTNGSHFSATNQCNEKSTIISPFLVGVQSKFRRKYYHKVTFTVMLIVILILLIAIFVLCFKSRRHPVKCETKECLRTAANLLQTMDTTIDPCEDFYRFACGNWAEEHPRPDSLTSFDWFSELQTKITRHVRKFLQQNQTNSEPKAIGKVKTLYQACIDVEGLEERGVQPILGYLKEFHLPAIPTMLNKTQLAKNVTDNGSPYKFDWIRAIVNVKRILGMDIIIGFDIFPDPKNRSVNRIAVGTPESGSALPFNENEHYKRLNRERRRIMLKSIEAADGDTEDKEDNEESNDDGDTISAYGSYIRKVSAVIMATVDPDIDIDGTIDTLTAAAKKAISITSELYKFNEEAENLTKSEDIINLTLVELQKETDEIISPKTLPIWHRYMAEMMNGTKSGFDIDVDEILTSKADIRYLQLAVQYLSEADLKAIEYYIWWTVVEELAVHTTIQLRQFHNDYIQTIIKTEGSQSRSLYCTNGINNMMGMAVSYSLADRKFTAETKPKVENMLANIQLAFSNLVKTTGWMDDVTKLQTLEKASSMKSLIGFPEWITNGTALDTFYDGVEVNATTHLENMIGILKWRIQKKLDTLKKPNEFGWATAPSHVNAFHTFQANTITIPIAILQYPFYGLGLEALNYGAIGTILGHELTHGFDDSGRMFDKTGNMRQWWTNKTIEEYVNRTTCFVKQYSGYFIPEADDYINGDLTLGENIADNGGLREAYHAYKLYLEQNGPEPVLPGLERYTNEQLLFISFGNLWCESATTAAMKYALEDTHSPGHIRLKGVLSNSLEFSRAFGCRKGSAMFPTENRCRLW